MREVRGPVEVSEVVETASEGTYREGGSGGGQG